MDESLLSIVDSLDNYSIISNVSMYDNNARNFTRVTRRVPTLVINALANKKYVLNYNEKLIPQKYSIAIHKGRLILDYCYIRTDS